MSEIAGRAIERATGRIRLPVLVGILALAGAYYGAAKIGYVFGITGPIAAIIWLPVGVGIAFLYIGGLRFAPGIVLVSLPGHSRGHACIAVDAGHRWVLHCGDAFYHYGSLDGTHVPRTLWAMETAVAFDRKKMWDNHARLSELYSQAESDLCIVPAHDMKLFERAKASAELSA